MTFLANIIAKVFCHQRRGFTRTKIKVRISTPLRASYLNGLVFDFARGYWKLAVFAVLIDWLLVWFQIAAPLSMLPSYDRMMCLKVLGGAAAVMWLEQLCLYPVSRLIFGKTLTFSFRSDKLVIRGAGFGKAYPLDTRLSLAASEIRGARNDWYQQSRFLNLIVNDIKEVRLAEVYPASIAIKLSEAVNLQLRKGAGFERSYDLDPRREKDA